MRRNATNQLVTLTLIIIVAGSAGAAVAGDGSVAGSFDVNNELPAGWELRTVLRAEGSTEALASQPATRQRTASSSPSEQSGSLVRSMAYPIVRISIRARRLWPHPPSQPPKKRLLIAT